MPSIIRKLKRFENMKLSNMQDLGGVRIIFDKLDDVNEFSKNLKNKTYPENKKNSFFFKSEKNYIESKKSDGYRSIHQIYQYNGKIENLKGYRLELQIRTKLQHQWATAVEIFDILEKTNIKFGQINNEYNKFFELVSILFEKKELGDKYSVEEIENVKNEVRNLNSKYNILDKLTGIAIVNEKLPIDKGSILMILDIDEKKIRYSTNSDDNILKKFYISLEEEYRDDISKEVVLVTLDDLKDLKKAYPNYFLDSKLFIKEVIKEIK